MNKYLSVIFLVSSLVSQIDYNTQIQPIFNNNCISCHVNGGGYAGLLDLSSYSETMEGGNSGNAVMPLEHSNSLLYNRITLPESNQQFMPKLGTALSQSDIDLIAQWIDEGALEIPEDVDCYAADSTEGVEIWGNCYSISNTTQLGFPISIPDTASIFPQEIFSLTNLTLLSLNSSNISGPIPSEISNLAQLVTLNLSGNQISGSIPSEIGILDSLSSLNLSSNQLTGEIPLEILNLTNLEGGIRGAILGTVFEHGLNLSNNMLVGQIPESIGNLSKVKSIDFSSNQLTGIIPIQLYSLQNLLSLNLSDNSLSGEIVTEIGDLTSLEGVITTAHNSSTTYSALDISNNQFSGSLPQSMCNLPIEWDNFGSNDQLFDFGGNQFCPTYPSCIEFSVGDQDVSNCASTSSSIEGRWVLEQFTNTMYEFDGQVRLTYYCSSTDACDSTYWNSLDSSDAIPARHPYAFVDDTLTIDLHFGNIFKEKVVFLCDGKVVDFNSQRTNWFRLGTDIGQCDDYEGQQLGTSFTANGPTSFRLHQNYPNPFNPITSLGYDLAENGFVNVTIYDMAGKIVKTLLNTYQSKGFKSIQWNATNHRNELVSAGVYLYVIETGKFRQTKKMLLLK
jgi:hypothetical protein